MNLISEFFQIYGSDIFQIAASWILSLVIFIALIIYISKPPEKRAAPIKITFFIMFLGVTAVISEINLIFGINSDSVTFGRNLPGKKISACVCGQHNKR